MAQSPITSSSSYCGESKFTIQKRTPSRTPKNFWAFALRALWAFGAHFFNPFSLVFCLFYFSLVCILTAFVCSTFLHSRHRIFWISLVLHLQCTHGQDKDPCKAVDLSIASEVLEQFDTRVWTHLHDCAGKSGTLNPFYSRSEKG